MNLGKNKNPLTTMVKKTSTNLVFFYLSNLVYFYLQSCPLRPILSSTGSYNRECATWLSEILTPLRHHPSSLKDTFNFLDKIKNLTPGNKLMANLDVKSLFTSVPVNFTIGLMLNNIFNNGVKDFNGLNRQQMKKLLTWTCKGTVFQFGGTFMNKQKE